MVVAGEGEEVEIEEGDEMSVQLSTQHGEQRIMDVKSNQSVQEAVRSALELARGKSVEVLLGTQSTCIAYLLPHLGQPSYCR